MATTGLAGASGTQPGVLTHSPFTRREDNSVYQIMEDEDALNS